MKTIYENIEMPDYSKLNENDDSVHIIIEQINITLPALFINSDILSQTSLKTNLKFGILYSGSSDIYVLLVFLYINFLGTSMNSTL